jgi:hypothetical protein
MKIYMSIIEYFVCYIRCSDGLVGSAVVDESPWPSFPMLDSSSASLALTIMICVLLSLLVPGELLFRQPQGNVTCLVLLNLPPLSFELDAADS